MGPGDESDKVVSRSPPVRFPARAFGTKAATAHSLSLSLSQQQPSRFRNSVISAHGAKPILKHKWPLAKPHLLMSAPHICLPSPCLSPG